MSVPEEEETLLPLTQRWPRMSKFLLSGCAATVAELGTSRPRLGLPSEWPWHRAGGGMGGQPRSRLEHLQRLHPRKDVVRCPVGQLREEHGLEVSRVVFPPRGMMSNA